MKGNIDSRENIDQIEPKFITIQPDHTYYGGDHPLMFGSPPSWATEWGQDDQGPFVMFHHIRFRFYAGQEGSFTGFWYSEVNQLLTVADWGATSAQPASDFELALINRDFDRATDLFRSGVARHTIRVLDEPEIEYSQWPGQNIFKERLDQNMSIIAECRQIRSSFPKQAPRLNQEPLPYTADEQIQISENPAMERMITRKYADTPAKRQNDYECFAAFLANIAYEEKILTSTETGISNTLVRDISALPSEFIVADIYKLADYIRLLQSILKKVTKDMTASSHGYYGFNTAQFTQIHD